MLVINCVQADANEPSAFLGAHCCFTVHEGGPSLVSRFFLTTLGRIESGAVLGINWSKRGPIVPLRTKAKKSR